MPDWHFTSIFFPYPGTDLYLLCKERGLLKSPLDIEMERIKATLDLDGLSRRQIQKLYIWFDYYVYKGRKPIYKILAKVMVSFLRRGAYSFYLYQRLIYAGFFRWLRNKFRMY